MFFTFRLKKMIFFILMIITLTLVSLLLFLTYTADSENNCHLQEQEWEEIESESVFAPITSCEKLQTLINSDQKIAFITFDDGPTQKMTPKILDILDEEDVKATFFVVGKHVKEHPALIKRMYEAGHYIANHGYSHNLKKLYQNEESFTEEIQKTDQEIAQAIDEQEYCSYFFRFPEGFMSSKYKYQKESALELLKEMNYEYVDWNCLNKDSEKKISNKELFNNLKKTAQNKTVLVILMHDTGDVNCTDEVLKESIQYFKEQGYTFHTFYDFL